MATSQQIVLRHRPGAQLARTGKRYQVTQASGQALGAGFSAEEAWDDALDYLENNNLRALQKMQ